MSKEQFVEIMMKEERRKRVLEARLKEQDYKALKCSSMTREYKKYRR